MRRGRPKSNNLPPGVYREAASGRFYAEIRTEAWSRKSPRFEVAQDAVDWLDTIRELRDDGTDYDLPTLLRLLLLAWRDGDIAATGRGSAVLQEIEKKV